MVYILKTHTHNLKMFLLCSYKPMINFVFQLTIMTTTDGKGKLEL